MALDERDVELIAYESARLVQGGWKYIGAGRWVHPDYAVQHERRIALGLQEQRERAQPHKAVTERRFPALRAPTTTPSPLPVVAPPSPPTTKPVTQSGTRYFTGFDDDPSGENK